MNKQECHKILFGQISLVLLWVFRCFRSSSTRDPWPIYPVVGWVFVPAAILHKSAYKKQRKRILSLMPWFLLWCRGQSVCCKASTLQSLSIFPSKACALPPQPCLWQLHKTISLALLQTDRTGTVCPGPSSQAITSPMWFSQKGFYVTTNLQLYTLSINFKHLAGHQHCWSKCTILRSDSVLCALWIIVFMSS